MVYNCYLNKPNTINRDDDDNSEGDGDGDDEDDDVDEEYDNIHFTGEDLG